MRSNRMALVIAALMCTASVGAAVIRPDTKAAKLEPVISLEAMIPKQFGEWREEPQRTLQIVNPETLALLDKLYADVFAHTYVNADGYRIMLSVVYGSDQRGELQAHKPEACYAASGFRLARTEEGQLTTPFGELSVQRLFTSKGSREEPVTYWLKFGDEAVSGDKAERTLRRRLVELRYQFTGRVPDGLLFRVSSIDPDQNRANRMQDQFINQLLQTLSPAERRRLTGLGDS